MCCVAVSQAGKRLNASLVSRARGLVKPRSVFNPFNFLIFSIAILLSLFSLHLKSNNALTATYLLLRRVTKNVIAAPSAIEAASM